MARKINFKKPREGDDAQYVRDRPWLIRDKALEGITVRFADDLDGDFEVDEEEPDNESGEAEETEEAEVEDYSGAEWTVKALTAEIDARNEDREEDDQIIPDTAKKPDLIAALLLDDEAQAEAEEEEDDSNEE